MTETPDTAQHAGRTALLPAHDAADTLVRTLPAPDADSVRTPAADTLAPLFAAEAADTLPVPVRTAAPAEVYGAASYPGAAPALPDPAPLAGDPLFQLLVLLTASFCALFAARHAADIVQLFSRTVHDPGSLSDARSNGRDRFLLIASVLGLLLA